ncbi:MAG: translation initiation factor IF-2, partial [Dehalococcoidia bacterium]|nr:translation initiation factor IF-2 [Dehalococcoidia bacterium]
RAAGLGFETQKEEQKAVEAVEHEEVTTAGKRVKAKTPSDWRPRPPVVTIMGHVDHGKTSLLDAIRQTNVIATEAGQITQHIGAYQIEMDGQKITFLDTPGHEAFTAMRARGAQVTDIAVLVVAADDGVMPQTVEAINHARAAGVPIVVAMTKIDRPNANPERVKKQLSELGLIIEEWGGEVIIVPVSSRTKQGIADLLASIRVVAEITELQANYAMPAEGVVVEAGMDKTRGPIATVLVQRGTLNVGGVVVVGSTLGKIKAMFDDKGRGVKKAEPATPVKIMGLNGVPQAGDKLSVVADEARAKELMARWQTDGSKATPARGNITLDALYSKVASGQIKELNVILKTDVQGSIEPIRNSLERLGEDKLRVRVLHAGTGSITESDVFLAVASKAIIVGFNSRAEPGAKHLAEAEGVDVRFYDIIYNLAGDIEKALQGMLEPTYIEVIEGRAEVRAVFPGRKKSAVAGVSVQEGKIMRDSPVRVMRKGEVLHESRVSSLRRFKDNVSELQKGFDGGVGVEGFGEFQVGDILESYRKQKQGVPS